MRPPRPPQANPVGFLFLNKVYREECEGGVHSPERAIISNREQADRIAQGLINVLQVYGEDFPTLELDDPCRNMPSLPITLKSGSNWSGWGPAKEACVLSPSKKSDEPWWLGSLTIKARPGDEPYIETIRLNRQLQNGQYTELDLLGRSTVVDPTYGYTAHVEAMNFIGIVGTYLEALARSRLSLLKPIDQAAS